MKRTWILVALIVVIAAVAGVRAWPQATPPPTPIIRYVSINRILTESLEGKSENAKLLAAQQEKTAALRQMQTTLQDIQQQIQTALDPAARTALQQKEAQQRVDMDRAAQQVQNELQTMQRQIQTSLGQRAKQVLGTLMKDQTAIVVGMETTVVWGSPSLDITDAVLAGMNAGR